MPREGILIRNPLERLIGEQVEQLHETSLAILRETGLICHNRRAVGIFRTHGADVSDLSGGTWLVKIPGTLVNKALESAPSTVTLGARNPDNALVMKGDEARVYLVTGSETNTWLDTRFVTYTAGDGSGKEIRVPEFLPRRGTVSDLCASAHVCEHLDNVDGYIRTVNIQDKDITVDNKDVNKYFASLNNTTKHVMAGLTTLSQLDNVVKMGEIIAGSAEKLRENPVLSFITCLVKSPLQFVDDTTETFIELCRRGLPVVVSSSPQAGTSAPIREAGIIAQINAEVLAGITLGQLVNPGTPLLYGSVPVRARMDTLSDSYGAVETARYNVDCSQMARYYRLPNYSTAGVCDPKLPGQQSTMERLFSDILVTLSGPQFLHCTFGLLDGNSVFSLLQAVLDDAHFTRLRYFLREPNVDSVELEAMKKQIADTFATDQKMFISCIRPVLRSGELCPPYPFESRNGDDAVFELADRRLQELLARPVEHIDEETTQTLFREIPGLLPRLNIYKGGH
jgi:trimethylamine---corrinoid protein Co-methyltransferase